VPLFKTTITLVALLLLTVAAQAGTGGDRAVFLLRSSVIGAGGVPGENGNMKTVGTLGQTAIGAGTNSSFQLYSGFWQKLSVSTGVLEGALPGVFRNALIGNAPNPFNPVTTICYEVGETAPVEVSIYSVQGRLVRILVNETKSSGRYESIWDGRDERGMSVGSGMYLYRLRIGDFHSIRKMLLLK